MYADVEIQGEEINNLLEEFRECLNSLDNLSPAAKRSRFDDVTRFSQQIRTAREAYLLELRALPAEDARVYESRLNEYMIQFKNLTNDAEWKKTEISRNQLIDPENDENEVEVDEMFREQLMKYGDQVQGKTLESVQRMKHIVGETEQIGQEVIQQLDEQTEQMARIHEKMNDVEYNLKRAQKTMKSIAKNAASDRCLQITCILIVIMVIVVAVLLGTGNFQ